MNTNQRKILGTDLLVAESIRIDDLVEAQLSNWDRLVHSLESEDFSDPRGLKTFFDCLFPIVGNWVPVSKNKDRQDTLVLEKLRFSDPRYTNWREYIGRSGISYQRTIIGTLKRITKERIHRGGQTETQLKEIAQKEIELFSIPEMTPLGTFVISGIERVVMMQLSRSPGVYILPSSDDDRSERVVRIIPNRGLWLNLEFDSARNIIVSFSNRSKTKISFPTFIRMLGYSNEDVISVYKRVQEFTSDFIGNDDYVITQDLIDEKTGEVLADELDPYDESIQRNLKRHPKLKGLDVVKKDSVIQSLIFERNRTINVRNDHLQRWLRTAFQEQVYYSLGPLGKLNLKTRLSLEQRDDGADQLTLHDLIAAAQLLEKANEKTDNRYRLPIDDIDNLKNRRVRCVAEQLIDYVLYPEIPKIISFATNGMKTDYGINKDIPERLLFFDTLQKSIDYFFNARRSVTSTSQYMEQVNPLSGLTQRRRVTVLGPGGLNRANAGVEIRDVHQSYFGRLCPIETPEGANIGLITSLAVYAKLDEYGRITTPYHPVKDGIVSKQFQWLPANDSTGSQSVNIPDEDNACIASADEPMNESGKLLNNQIMCRYGQDIKTVHPKEINYKEVSTFQMLSLSAGLIPFVAHDDANRALMGANMQRQAVPLNYCEAPLVGTGIEKFCVADLCIKAKNNSVIKSVSADRIVCYDEVFHDEVIYDLPHQQVSNQGTSLTYKPVVLPGESIGKDEILADCYSSKNGELALGRNILVAFMPFDGWNYEDAVVVSERLLREKTFQSTYLEEYFVDVLNTSLGPEELTRDIPNISDHVREKLDDRGIIKIGTIIEKGDVLVGKITPKAAESDSLSDLSVEEKMIRAIFGKKADPFIDSSLKAGEAVGGTIIDVKLYSRKNPRCGKMPNLQSVHEDFDKKKSALIQDFEKQSKKIKQTKKRLSDQFDFVRKILAKETLSHFDFAEARSLSEKMKVAATTAELNDLYEALRSVCAETGQKDQFDDFDAIHESDIKNLDEQLVSAELDMLDARLNNLQEAFNEDLSALNAAEEAATVSINETLREYNSLVEAKKALEVDYEKTIIKILESHADEVAVANSDFAYSIGDSITQEFAKRIINAMVSGYVPIDGPVGHLLRESYDAHKKNIIRINERIYWAKMQIEEGDPMAPGVLQTVVIRVAKNRPLSVGDKVSGRHGNKGVVSTILPIEDMPYLSDGTPIDIVLNPLGVPSRMNIGQILETMLGWAAKDLNVQIAVPAFCKGNEKEVVEFLKQARTEKLRRTAANGHAKKYEDLSNDELLNDINHLGQVWLYDGRTGVRYDNPVTVGYMYMLKLNHMVEDKLHARNIGGYSHITQQPLAGRARNGGQRLGEMEVWALEAYGAANILQEMLTVKSDDVEGRKLMYRNLTNGINRLNSGIPEATKVLQHELRGLCLDFQLLGAEPEITKDK